MFYLRETKDSTLTLPNQTIPKTYLLDQFLTFSKTPNQTCLISLKLDPVTSYALFTPLFYPAIFGTNIMLYVVDNHCFITHNDKQKGCVCKSKPQGYITIPGYRNILSLFLKVCMWLNELAKSIHAF